MKKIYIITLSALLLIACSEQQEYKQIVRQQISNDPDIQSYHLDVEKITHCIVDLSSKKMPGFVPFEPIRKATYKGYSKMLAIKTSEKPAEFLAELHQIFGSKKALADAHRNYSKSYFECISTMNNFELDEKDAE